MQGIRASDEHSKSRGGTFAATGALGRLPRVSSDRWFDPACPCHPPSASPARAQVRSCSGGGDELVDVAHVLRLEDKRGDGAVLDLLRREADHHADRLARPPVHRAVVGRHREVRVRVSGKEAPVRREGVKHVLDGNFGERRLADTRPNLKCLCGQLVGVERQGAPVLAVEALRWERHELLQVGGQVLLRNLIVLGTLAPDVGRDCLLRVEVGPRQVFLRAKHHALALLLVGLVDGALVEPILKLLRANLVHAAGLAVVLGDLGDHLLGQAGRPAKVVLAGRRLAGVRRGLHPAPADVGAAIGDGRLAEPAADDRGRIVLIREVGVPITHDTATRVAAIELTVAAALEECLHRCVGLVNGAARKCALLALLHVFVPRARRAHRDLQRHNNRADAGKQRRGAAQCKREREGGCHACGGRARAQSARGTNT
mmetsp:Transcript_20372/g.63943  ORF Transcript_20372/g.63943 Transcript_20372/m.63943 type:complete len:429 (+) Transcript_20372:147-1433(+)